MVVTVLTFTGCDLRPGGKKSTQNQGSSEGDTRTVCKPNPDSLEITADSPFAPWGNCSLRGLRQLRVSSLIFAQLTANTIKQGKLIDFDVMSAVTNEARIKLRQAGIGVDELESATPSLQIVAKPDEYWWMLEMKLLEIARPERDARIMFSGQTWGAQQIVARQGRFPAPRQEISDMVDRFIVAHQDANK